MLDLTFDLGKNVVNDAAPPGHPDRHRQDPRLAAEGLHPDRDRRPGQAQPQRLRDQGPARGGQGSRPAFAPRPRPPTAGSAGTTITRSSGMARPASCTRVRPAAMSWSGCRDLFRETFDRDPRADHRRQPGASLAARTAERPASQARWPRQPSASIGGEQAEASPRSPGPGTTPTASTTWATSSWSGSGTRSRTTATPSSSPTARRSTVMLAKTLDARLPARRDRPRPAHRRRPDPAAGSLPGPPGGQAAPQGRHDRRPPRCPVRTDAPGRDPRRLRGCASQARGRRALSLTSHKIARIDSLRHLTETLDLLFDAYRRRRIGSGWSAGGQPDQTLADCGLGLEGRAGRNVSAGQHSGPRGVKKHVLNDCRSCALP